MNKLNVLVVGYGSIGRRHVHNMSKMDSIKNIIVYTKIKDSIDNICEKISFINAAKIDLDSAIDSYEIHFAIIANETYKHIDTAMILAQKHIHLLIEKPISHTIEAVVSLSAIVQKNQIKVFVAYNLRFLAAMKYLKEQISQKVIGDIYFAQIEVGQYLPSWRANVDYKNSYSANAAYGGGVALDLSHEVDYMCYLFGEPQFWKTIRSKVSELEINSEDIFEGIYKYKTGFICHVHMDYLQRNAVRKLRILGSGGEIICDFIGKWIEIILPERTMKLTDKNLFNLDDTYKAELEDFIQTLESKNEPSISIDDGINALKLLEDSSDRQQV
ncbi:MAG: Gfo/Idh/MocA family oxidoreductase [Desulfamplus sp.]|nr:Gfo/Idh/MocA family oxidoreductase [Desulfamplus sp.]